VQVISATTPRKREPEHAERADENEYPGRDGRTCDDPTVDDALACLGGKYKGRCPDSYARRDLQVARVHDSGHEQDHRRQCKRETGSCDP
jgi:hypothetical protein